MSSKSTYTRDDREAAIALMVATPNTPDFPTIMQITDLGGDILAVEVTRYILADDIFALLCVNRMFNTLFYRSQWLLEVFSRLYSAKFPNSDNDRTSTSDKLHWEQLFRRRVGSKLMVCTWGHQHMGHLGYMLTGLSRYSTSVRTNVPHAIPNFSGHIVCDIIATGYSFVILSNDGSLWYTGVNWTQSARLGLTPAPTASDFFPTPTELQWTAYTGISTNIPGVAPVHGQVGTMPMTAAPSSRFRILPHPSSIPARVTTSPHITSAPLAPTSARKRIVESNFTSKLELPPSNFQDRRVVAISGGREHIVALDNHNQIYTWDSGCKVDCAIQLKFAGLADARIVKIFAGWNLSGCVMHGIGLVIWYLRENVTKAQWEEHEYPLSDANFLVVPGTERGVVDFALTADHAIFIKRSDGKLHLFKCDAGTFARRRAEAGHPICYTPSELDLLVLPVTGFNKWLDDQNRDAMEHISFTSINARFHSFVVLTDSDQVVIGNHDHLEEQEEDESLPPEILPELQGKLIKRVEIGDYHFVALNRAGEMYSWGAESQNCGCLGLGNARDFTESHPDRVASPVDPHRINVIVPTMIEPPEQGQWVAVAAAGWHSGGIFVPDS